VLPRNTNLAPERPAFPRPSRTPRWLLIVSVLTMLAVLGMGYVSLRVVQRIRQFKGLSAEIRAAYQSAEARYRFTPPVEPAGLESDRISAYLRARERFFAAAPPEVEARVHSLLQRGRPASLRDTMRLVGSIHEFLRNGASMHLSALEEGQMGPAEFFWIHGWVVRSMLDPSSEDPRRKRLEETLKALEGTSEPVPGGARTFSADTFRNDLDRRFGLQPPLDRALLESYRIDTDLMACMDIIASTESLRSGLGLDSLPATRSEQALLEAPGTRGA
jgi:hypothetical protein